MNPKSLRFVLTVLCYCFMAFCVAQNNFVPNPGFEVLDDCDLEFGEAYKASPWEVINFPIASPDLFHSCSTNPFFEIPNASGCNIINPHSGEGIVGLVTLSVNENIYAPLTEPLPLNTDVYVAYNIIPRAKCDTDFETLCYTNTLCLGFADWQMQNAVTVIESDTVLDHTEDWTLMQACYRATGLEEIIRIGNFKITSETIINCDYTDPSGFNFAYYYVDDVIVSPFDVIPDTLYLCEGESLELDISFFDVPLEWGDGWDGGQRIIDQAGTYTIFGDIGDCDLMDKTLVIAVPSQDQNEVLPICDGEEILLHTPIEAVWENGDTASSRMVASPGTYTARLLSDCNESQMIFELTDFDCSIRHFVPNAFSPNDDGLNDKLAFFFYSDFEFTGTLNIFDRWGNLVFLSEGGSAMPVESWDGHFKNELLQPAVYVWMYNYVSAKDGVERVISGNVTLVR